MSNNRKIYIPKGAIILLAIFLIVNILYLRGAFKTYINDNFNIETAENGFEKGIGYYLPRVLLRIFICGEDIKQLFIVLALLVFSIFFVDMELIRNTKILLCIFLILGISGVFSYLGTPVKDYPIGTVPVMMTGAFGVIGIFSVVGLFNLIRFAISCSIVIGLLQIGGRNFDIGMEYIFFWRYIEIGTIVGLILVARRFILKRFFRFCLTDNTPDGNLINKN